MSYTSPRMVFLGLGWYRDVSIRAPKAGDIVHRGRGATHLARLGEG